MTDPTLIQPQPSRPSGSPPGRLDPVTASRRRTVRLGDRRDAWLEFLSQLGWAVAREDDHSRPVLNAIARQDLELPADSPILIGNHAWAKLRAALPADTTIAAAEAGLLIWQPRAARVANTTAVTALTPRESEIWRWLGVGKSADEIALILGRSKRTVQKHQQSLYRKLGVRRADQAIFAREP
ncbi:MAG: helix-turn-helix transcriptional regulator [Opitutales bacterium]